MRRTVARYFLPAQYVQNGNGKLKMKKQNGNSLKRVSKVSGIGQLSGLFCRHSVKLSARTVSKMSECDVQNRFVAVPSVSDGAVQNEGKMCPE